MSYKIEKVLNELPTDLEPNTFYYVRASQGFDTYLTTTSGVPIKQRELIQIQTTGRAYLVAGANRTFNINYGPSLQNWNSGFSSDANGRPLPTANVLGLLVDRPAKIDNIRFQYRANATEVMEIEFFIQKVKKNTGSAVVEITTLYQTTLNSSSTLPQLLVIDKADILDTVIQPDEHLIPVFRRATGSNTRYFPCNLQFNMEYV